ncbi:hypothetical protein JG688_00013512 [Phytophthora aleatoria]|uniref:Uncharacterized protein n=1 Tax=Phytophthora aleatoria TaxID=2496075 RepID=A0A8J5IDG3_9STRA|nr:hypothetical protein JG688_00013512 [Phytophthora aleatoria]
MVETARTTSPVHDDEHLRALTQLEAATLQAYMLGEIELRHPPGFLKTTFPVVHRAIIKDYHRSYVEYSLSLLGSSLTNGRSTCLSSKKSLWSIRGPTTASRWSPDWQKMQKESPLMADTR